MSLTNKIASADASLATTQWAFRNRIINGNCNIAQRPSFAYTTGLSGYGGPDRFFAANMGTAGGQFTQSQGTVAYNGVMYNAVMQTVNTAITSTTTTNYWSGISQAIEGYNIYNLLGGPVVLSFIFSASVTGTYSVAVSDYTRANSWVTTFTATANTPVKVVIPISMLPTTLTTPNTNAGGLWVNVGALNTGTYQTPTLNTWETGNYLSAAGATNWGMTANNFIALTNLQLEAGNIATTFENRHSNVEMAMCQRYYEYQTGQAIFWNGYINAGTPYNTVSSFHVTKRSTPTIAFSSIGYGSMSGITLVASTVDNVAVYATATTTSVGGSYYASFTASAEL